MSGPAVEALLSLQQLDIAIDQHRHQRTTLPQRSDLVALDGAEKSTVKARTEVERRRNEVAAVQQAAEVELASSEERMAAVRRRMSSGEAGSARDVEALSSGIDHLRERVSLLEDQVLVAMEERGPLDEQVTLADGELAGLAERRRELTVRLGSEEARLDGEIAELEARRDVARKTVTPQHLAIYDGLRPRLGGVAVALLIGTHCDGCHLTLPATELDRLRHGPADELVYCDQCGRILVRHP
jgi:predicted  nucleic acid-binding Zn-ribbon protein